MKTATNISNMFFAALVICTVSFFSGNRAQASEVYVNIYGNSGYTCNYPSGYTYTYTYTPAVRQYCPPPVYCPPTRYVNVYTPPPVYRPRVYVNRY